MLIIAFLCALCAPSKAEANSSFGPVCSWSSAQRALDVMVCSRVKIRRDSPNAICGGEQQLTWQGFDTPERASVPSLCHEHPGVKLHTFVHLHSLCVQQDEACLTTCFSKWRYLLAGHHSVAHKNTAWKDALLLGEARGWWAFKHDSCRYGDMVSAPWCQHREMWRTLPRVNHFYEQWNSILKIRGQTRN